MALKCLLVEDDAAFAEHAAQGLAQFGHSTRIVSSMAEALAAVAGDAVDVIILDRILPDGDSAGSLRKWREEGLTMPIVMLSAMSALHERIEGMDAGADDYLAKPFDIAELEARLRALVRLSARNAAGTTETMRIGDIELDYRRREVRRDGILVPLQPREFKLLDLLAANAGEIVPRSMLLKQVWNLRFDPRTKLIETHVSRLRDKLNHGHRGDVIETVRGVGYRLRADG